MDNIRGIALDALLEAESDGRASSGIITDILNKYDYLDQRDKAFIKLLFEGVTERRITLDFLLDKRSSVKTRKMKPVIRNILRMGYYQMLYTDSPSYAVCKESVNLAGKRGFKGLGGFVNGVLRNFAREIEALAKENKNVLENLLPKKGEIDNIKYLSICYSIPEVIISLIMKDYGERTESILSAMSGTKPVSLRFRSYMCEDEISQVIKHMEESGVILNQDSDIPYVYRASKTGDVRKLPGYDEGLFYIQDVSSIKAVISLDIKKGEKILDCCAAPGGKSILASEFTGDEGSVTSCDISEEKADLIRDNFDRLNCKNTSVIVKDASVNDPSFNEGFDTVILDVPCSGLGIMGKKRDIKYNLTEEGLSSLTDLQKKIIDSCVPYVKKGGKLMYSTCTLRKAENEQQVLYITENHGFEVVKGPVTLLPDEGEQDGFFYCILKKK
ncbi:MAG: 16S rRNA (cytosine(967)-C(5))-methyltransferase RsmB [Lachnospiraceae bacterium]|nr:16S rRNA (cytosine(967)-C(5))-methyltransferase RsmB [Lachnospiraceae bacterium]